MLAGALADPGNFPWPGCAHYRYSVADAARLT